MGLLRAADPVRRPAGRKLDATADRKAGVLVVNALHQDVDFPRTVDAAVGREIMDLARWLELDLALPA